MKKYKVVIDWINEDGSGAVEVTAWTLKNRWVEDFDVILGKSVKHELESVAGS